MSESTVVKNGCTHPNKVVNSLLSQGLFLLLLLEKIQSFLFSLCIFYVFTGIDYLRLWGQRAL
jgi:hypothetical protein